MGNNGGNEGGNEAAGDEFDLLKMDPNLLTFEQQIRRAELESLKDMRTQQMIQEGIQPNNNVATPEDSQNQNTIQIDGVSNQRLTDIINKDVNDMTEEEIIIYTQYCDKINENEEGN